MEGREVGVNNNAHTIKYTFICAIECLHQTITGLMLTGVVVFYYACIREVGDNNTEIKS